MTEHRQKILNSEQVKEIVPRLGEEFVLIENPNYIFSKFDICPLAPKIVEKRDRIVAVVQDMDGTTTTTETLCLHSLEMMVRHFTGRHSREQWDGLDRIRDYPHIIGNSTTKHVEYLIKSYQKDADPESFRRAYLRAAVITMAFGQDKGRKREVLSNLKNFQVTELLSENEVLKWQKTVDGANEIHLPGEVEKLLDRYAKKLELSSFTDQVRAAIDIYYQRYHEILFYIEHGKSEILRSILPEDDRNLIEPMSGVAVFLSTVKGWLGEELDRFFDEFYRILVVNPNEEKSSLILSEEKLKAIGRYFEENPIKVAIVTSSIAYEARIVLTQLFKVIQKQIASWKISDNRKKLLIDRFQSYRNVFDVVVTASDSSEIRLKPHRDLYSLALHQLGIAKEDFDKVIGFEDSESGTIAIRAAGIGLCVAVPFSDTQGHRLDYASYVLPGGIPEAMIKHEFFLTEKTLSKYQI